MYGVFCLSAANIDVASFLMTFAALMGATRTTVSLFILLMVSMGYGVVM